MKVGIKKLEHARDLALPFYATAGSAGLDLLAAVETEIELLPGARMAVPCGIAMELPPGVEAQIRPAPSTAIIAVRSRQS
jgi:dUTP pyrophosphatase